MKGDRTQSIHAQSTCEAAHPSPGTFQFQTHVGDSDFKTVREVNRYFASLSRLVGAAGFDDHLVEIAEARPTLDELAQVLARRSSARIASPPSNPDPYSFEGCARQVSRFIEDLRPVSEAMARHTREYWAERKRNEQERKEQRSAAAGAR